MKVLPRTKLGDPVLRKKAQSVPLAFIKTKKFRELTRRMIYTMRRSQGVGLAAPQIGISKAIAVMEMRKTPTRQNIEPRGPIVIVNPRIKSFSKKKIADYEGCLSFDGVRAMVSRSESITVEYHDMNGEKVTEKASGLWARIFQHEIDHLNGIVYVDRVDDSKTFMRVEEFKKRIVKKKK